MALLKTVLEVNLQLFHNKKERCLLQFVIRDFLGNTSMENLADTIMTDLNNIWASLSKPEGFENSVINDFFDVGFTGLPHKILCSDAFSEAVDSLRERFVDNNNSDYIFNVSYHKKIPADGFSLYTREIWDTIENNKDLDLPTQQQLLAQYRCDEIITEVMEPFSTACTILQKEFLPGNLCKDLPTKLLNMFETVIEAYDRQASRYNVHIYQKKKQELIASVDSHLYVFFQAQLNALHKELIKSFFDASNEFPSDTPFKESSSIKINELVNKMREEGESLSLPHVHWDVDPFILKLSEELTQNSETLCKEKLKEKLEELFTGFEFEVSEAVEVAFQKLSHNVWDTLLNEFLAAQNTTIEKIKNIVPFYVDIDDTKTTEEYIINFKKNSWLFFRKKIDSEMSEVLLQQRLRVYFEELFRYDSDGMPKLWKKSGTIDRDYRESLTKTLDLINVLASIKVSDGNYPDLNVDIKTLEPEYTSPASFFTILNRRRVSDISVNFKRSADLIFMDCKRSVINTTTRIPPYFWVLLIVLGWNEFMAILRNPFVFMILMFGGTVVYGLYISGLIWPAKMVLERATNNLVDLATDRFSNTYQEQVQQRAMQRTEKSGSPVASADDAEAEKTALS